MARVVPHLFSLVVFLFLSVKLTEGKHLVFISITDVGWTVVWKSGWCGGWWNTVTCKRAHHACLSDAWRLKSDLHISVCLQCSVIPWHYPLAVSLNIDHIVLAVFLYQFLSWRAATVKGANISPVNWVALSVCWARPTDMQNSLRKTS